MSAALEFIWLAFITLAWGLIALSLLVWTDQAAACLHEMLREHRRRRGWSRARATMLARLQCHFARQPDTADASGIPCRTESTAAVGTSTPGRRAFNLVGDIRVCPHRSTTPKP
jgi:hypothetical protein